MTPILTTRGCWASAETHITRTSRRDGGSGESNQRRCHDFHCRSFSIARVVPHSLTEEKSTDFSMTASEQTVQRPAPSGCGRQLPHLAF